MNEAEKAPSWSPEEAEFAEEFLKLSHLHPGTFEEKKDAVAKAMSYEHHLFAAYRDFPQGVRSYIAHKGAEAVRTRKLTEWKAGMNVKVRNASVEWEERYNTDATFRHGMTHPDDGEPFLPEKEA